MASSASRRSGSQVAALLVTGIVATLGVSTVYLPFIADKDKVRGLHEESDISDPRAKREYEAILQQMQQEANQHNHNNNEATQQGQAPPRPSNSMWNRFKKQ
jgi:hypothetical protein